jgi:hypothetical protein
MLAFFILWNLFAAPISWSERFDAYTLKIALALAQPPIVHLEAEQLAITFVGTTLPNLLAQDPLLAKQVGFKTDQDLRAFEEFGAMLEAPLPLFIIDMNDLKDFVKKQTHPLKLLTKAINWTTVSGEDPVPARLLFPIRLKHEGENSGHVVRSSVVIGKTPSTTWRIYQAGGPALMRAVKTFSTSDRDFVVWIPGINRHYLGRMSNALRFKMTVLFDDPIARVNAGHEFDPADSDVIDKLKKLDKLVELHTTAKPMEEGIAGPIRRRARTPGP